MSNTTATATATTILLDIWQILCRRKALVGSAGCCHNDDEKDPHFWTQNLAAWNTAVENVLTGKSPQAWAAVDTTTAVTEEDDRIFSNSSSNKNNMSLQEQLHWIVKISIRLHAFFLWAAVSAASSEDEMATAKISLYDNHQDDLDSSECDLKCAIHNCEMATQAFVDAWKTTTKSTITDTPPNGNNNNDNNNNIKKNDVILLQSLQIFRAVKNWLRWYLQIFDAEILQQTPTNEIVACYDKDKDYLRDPLQCFKSDPMLELVLLLLERQRIQQQQQQALPSAPRLSIARHAAQALFYATYAISLERSCVVAKNFSAQDAAAIHKTHIYRYLCDDLHFFTRLLQLLVSIPIPCVKSPPLHQQRQQAEFVPLEVERTPAQLQQQQVMEDALAYTLALVRNVHNGLVSFPKSGIYVAEASCAVVVIDPVSSAVDADLAVSCPWAPRGAAAAPTVVGEEKTYQATYSTVLRDILSWILKQLQAETNVYCELYLELLLEILRIFYALRTGQELSLGTDKGEPSHESLARAVLDLLCLSSTQNDESFPTKTAAGANKLLYECRLATVSLLMDSSHTFADFLLSAGSDPASERTSTISRPVQSLLDIFQTQVSSVVSASSVDNAAAAALTPILVVLHKYCSACAEFRRITKQFLFPVQAEEHFQNLIAEQKRQEEKQNDNCMSSGRNDHPMANMSPLDAPPETLRGKVMKLLTWPQGHVKRFTGELLWILCNQDSQEFIHRVGMGNAMPLLASKGIVKLPSHVQG